MPIGLCRFARTTNPTPSISGHRHDRQTARRSALTDVCIGAIAITTSCYTTDSSQITSSPKVLPIKLIFFQMRIESYMSFACPLHTQRRHRHACSSIIVSFRRTRKARLQKIWYRAISKSLRVNVRIVCVE